MLSTQIGEVLKLASSVFPQAMILDPIDSFEEYVKQHNQTEEVLQVAPGYNEHFSVLAHQLMAEYLENRIVDHFKLRFSAEF